MIFITDNRTAEQRKAAEAENTRPLTWEEYRGAINTAPAGKRAGLIDRLQMETVPEELRGLLDACKHGKR